MVFPYVHSALCAQKKSTLRLIYIWDSVNWKLPIEIQLIASAPLLKLISRNLLGDELPQEKPGQRTSKTGRHRILHRYI